MREVEAAEPPAPRRINRDIPRDLETVLLKCIAKQRDDRYSTAAELADELRRFLAGRPPLARRPTVGGAIVSLGPTAHSPGDGCRRAGADRADGHQRRGDHDRPAEAAHRAGADRGAENFNRAERNFQQARQIVDRFWTRAAGQLADVPGAESLRRELLGEAREYYRGFIQQARHNASLAGRPGRGLFSRGRDQRATGRGRGSALRVRGSAATLAASGGSAGRLRKRTWRCAKTTWACCRAGKAS